MKTWIPLLTLIILIPGAQAAFTDSREWSAYAVSFTDPDGVVPATSFTLNSAPHGFTVTSRVTHIQWTAQLTTTPANAGQIDEYSMTMIIKEAGATKITCSGVSFSRLAIPDLGRFQSTFLSFCMGTGSNALVPGTTYTYEVTVTMISGTNHAVQSGQSIKIQQTDSFTDSNHEAGSGSGGLDLQFLDMTVQESWTLLFLFGMMLLAMWKGWPWIWGITVAAIGITFIPGLPINFEWAVAMLVIAFGIQYLGGGFRPVTKGLGFGGDDRL